MEKFSYDITIEAKAEQEALAKMAAISTLAALLTAQELTKLAYIVRNDPAKTALAKKYLSV